MYDDDYFYYDDLVAYADQEFNGYVPDTVNPMPWTLIGTTAICVALLGLAVTFLKLRRRRRKRQKRQRQREQMLAQLAESASFDEQSSIEIQFLTTDFNALVQKRPAARTMRLQGWGDIAQSVLEEDDVVKKRWSQTTKQEEQLIAEDILDRDLFESGGVMHQLNKRLVGTTTPTIPENEVAVDNNNKPSGAAADDEDTSVETGTSAAGTDYKLMDDGEHVGSEDKNSPTTTSPKKESLAYLLSLCKRDKEYSKILKLAVPYSINSIIESFFDILTLVVVGKMMGTRELSAYIMVAYMVAITTMFLEGIMSSLTAVCSQAIGAQMYGLAGQYTQIAIIFYVVLFLPQLAFWWNRVDNVMIWMEFDDDVAQMAQAYARVFVVSTIFEAVHEAFTFLLDVSGYEKFTTGADCAHSATFFTALVAIVAWGKNPIFGGEPNLQTIAYLNLFVDVIFLLGKVLYMKQKKRWWDNYWPGLAGNFALLNFQAVKRFLKTAIPLSFGFVLSYGEWEVLFLMASTLGPAEVAAWGLLGEIWSSLEGLTDAWGDAAEVRCARLLGGGNADGAELSAHKSLALGTIGSLFGSLILAACSGHLAGWITTDVTLKSMVTELLPFVCLGNVTLAVGSISWQLVGAQTRYSLATAVQFVGSWLVTLPLALLSSMYWHWNLSGLVAAVVIGNMVAGMLNFVILCCTDWDRTANKILRKNAKIGEESDGLMQKPANSDAAGVQMINTGSSSQEPNVDKSQDGTSPPSQNVDTGSASAGSRSQGPIDLDKSFSNEDEDKDNQRSTSIFRNPLPLPGSRDSQAIKRSRSEDIPCSPKRVEESPVKRVGSFRFWRKRSSPPPSPETLERIRTPMPSVEIKLEENVGGNLT